MYSNKFVLCVLVNGHPAKELANGVVKIPFGEYALRFRNKHDRRAVVKITIDGENVGGEGYIIPANSYVDIERWADKPVKFKFVALDSEEAIDFGKNGPNEDKVKGTIEARFYLEKEAPKVFYNPPIEHHYHHHHYPKPNPPIWYTTLGGSYGSSPTWTTNDNLKSCSTSSVRKSSMARTHLSDAASHVASCSDNTASLGFCGLSDAIPTNSSTPVMDGCTVEGNYSSQSFRSVWFDAETDYVSLKVFLQGFDDDTITRPKPVRSRETVKSKKLRELEEENQRLKDELVRKQLEDKEAEALRKLEEENKRLRESLEK